MGFGTSLVTKATLLVIQGADQGARFEISDAPLTVGRGVGNQIRILDTEVSREHAGIHFADGKFFLTDRRSSNGTYVNGAPIRERELSNGDQIQMGRSVLLFNREATEGLSGEASRRVDLVTRRGIQDQSNIVGQVSSDAGRKYVVDPEVRSTQALTQSLANLQALYRVSEESVRPSISPTQMLQRVLDLTIEVVGADRGCVLLSDPTTHEIVPEVFSLRRGTDDSKMPVSRSIVDYVIEHRQGVRTSDARSDDRFEPGQSIFQAGIREAMCVPIQGRADLLGVIYVDITTPPERVVLEGRASQGFSEEQLRLLAAIGRQSALAVENNRHQQALLKAERLAAMGQTIAMLSHHIKNILQGIRGGSYLIDMGLTDHSEEMIRKGWGIVEKNQNKIYHLVMDMLTFSKERQPVLERADLNEVLSDVCELMQARAEECGAILTTNLDKSVPTNTFEPEGIHRAVLNIVTNAIDAVDGVDGAHIIVESSFEQETDMLMVVVSDNGPGIPKEQLQKIFNIFESTKGARGTGLGLAVSQKILREHGGDITVDSAPGTGCRFTLAWPRIDDSHAELNTQV